MKRHTLVLVWMLALFAVPCVAQQKDADAVIGERWSAILKEVQGKRAAPAIAAAPEVQAAHKREVYREAVAKLSQDPALRRFAQPDLGLVTEQTRKEDRALIQELKTSNVENKTAKAVDNRSTNPVTLGVAERSGFTEFIALALSGQNFFNANETAVTLNLNALALFSLADADVFSELYRYQQHSTLRRISGSVTFGAKIPEKAITGLSGLPDAEKLFDVFAWDVKVRLLGDRDPRSPQWYPLTLGRAGLQNEINTTVAGLVPVEDAAIIQEVLNEHLGAAVKALKRQIDRSMQLSFKTSGTHLTEEVGRNKYVGELLFDAGIGPKADVTANLLYSVTDDVRLGAESPFKVKQWTFNASLTTHFGENAIVKGRAIDWNSGVAVNLFQDKAALPITVENTWKLFTTLDIPVADAAKVPISVVYTNDPNALTKQKYASGFIGINYDFSALGKLFKGGE